ncbi:MAG: PAS domain-containing protein, partial [Flavobacteriales bacterium]
MSSDLQSVFQNVMNGIPSPVFVLDTSGAIQQSNTCSAQLLSKWLEDVTTINHFDDLEISSSFLKKRIFWSDIEDIILQESLELQVSMLNEGKFYKLRISLFETDKIRFFLLAFAEITSKIQLQDELLAPNGFLDHFLNGLPQLICAIDERNLIRFWNKQCQQVLGYTDQDVC